MKNRTLWPFWFLIIFILIVSTACNLPFSKSKGTDTPTEAATTSPIESSKNLVTTLSDVKKAVIQIQAEGTFMDPEFGLQVNSAGRGSGFIITPSGIAVTNNHVVTGAALIKVWVNGESQPRNARLLGYSECNDLAVIQIDGSDFSYLKWYEGAIDAGLEIYLAGFPLGAPEFSLTKGIISKSNTPGDTSWTSIKGGVLAHDATANPGTSGGPLVTSDGQVVGIHFAGNKSTDQYFAISSTTAIPIVMKLMTGVNFESLGVNGSIVSNEDGSISGVWVASVASGSASNKAGLKPGDIILQLEGLVLGTDGTMADYCSVIRTHGDKEVLSLNVLRYPTGELLEGEINGRELAVTGQLDTSGSTSSGDTSTTASGEAYFTDEFDNGLDNYSLFTMSGDSNDPNMGVFADNGNLVFDLQGANLWPYVTYDPFTYEDVRVDFQAENLGNNNNMVALICRYDPERGWYEFNVANNGLYWIYYYDAIGLKDYSKLYDGGSTTIRMGRATNTYTITCQGDSLTLYINGVLARSVRDSNLKEGQIGVSVSSFADFPVVVDINWLQVSQP